MYVSQCVILVWWCVLTAWEVSRPKTMSAPTGLLRSEAVKISVSQGVALVKKRVLTPWDVSWSKDTFWPVSGAALRVFFREIRPENRGFSRREHHLKVRFDTSPPSDTDQIEFLDHDLSQGVKIHLETRIIPWEPDIFTASDPEKPVGADMALNLETSQGVKTLSDKDHTLRNWYFYGTALRKQLPLIRRWTFRFLKE